MENIKSMEIMLKSENKEEAEEVMQFISELDKEEKNNFLAFIRGAKFMRNLFPQMAAQKM